MISPRSPAAYAGRGSTAYHPEVLLSLLVYGYATGVFSSRRIERAIYDSLAFRYLAAGSHPDHDTLATLRRRFFGELSGIFLQVLELAESADQADIPDGMNALRDQMPARPAGRHGSGEDQDRSAGSRSLRTGTCGLGREARPTLRAHSGSWTDARRQAALTSGGRPLRIRIVDCGYYSENNLAAVDAAGIEPLIALEREDHHPGVKDRFTEPTPIDTDATPKDRMENRLKTKLGWMLYALRKQMVEPVFGFIKSVMGFRQFLLRVLKGMEKVTREWQLMHRNQFELIKNSAMNG